MYQRILVPIDGSETATLGLHEAIKLAKNHGATIRLVHVVNEMIVVDATAVNLGVIIDRLREGGASLLGEAAAAVRGAGVEVDTTPGSGERSGGHPHRAGGQGLARGSHRVRYTWTSRHPADRDRKRCRIRRAPHARSVLLVRSPGPRPE